MVIVHFLLYIFGFEFKMTKDLFIKLYVLRNKIYVNAQFTNGIEIFVIFLVQVLFWTLI